LTSSGWATISPGAGAADPLCVAKGNEEGAWENVRARKEERMKRAARAEVNAVDGDVVVELGMGTGGTADMLRGVLKMRL
jgi:hypothetical protein